MPVITRTYEPVIAIEMNESVGSILVLSIEKPSFYVRFILDKKPSGKH